MEVFRINGEERYTTVENLKKLLLENMKKKRQVRVYWKNCSESARLLKDGTIKALGRLGGRDWKEHVMYKNFDNWFEESIIKENSIDIELKIN
jgi:hypothetical protein